MDKISEITGLIIDINKMKMTAASMNIANSEDVSGSFNTVYKKISVSVTGSGNLADAVINDSSISDLITVNYIESQDVKKRYAPKNPIADSSGFVYSSNIDHTEQMLEVQESKRIYETGLKIYQMNIDMNSSILRLGK